MARGFNVKLEGLGDLKATFMELAPRESENLQRATVHGIAGLVRDQISAAAPFAHLRDGFRSVRRRGQRGRPVSEVRAKKSAADWRWFEFGTAERFQRTTGRRAGRITAQPFVHPKVEDVRRQMPQIYREQYGAKLEKMLRRRAKAK